MPKEVQLYLDLLSQPSRLILWFCKLNNIPHKVNLVQVAKGQPRSEEHAKRNPLKKVPSIEYDGFNLAESHAIIRYLNSKFKINSPWYPENLERRAKVDQYLDWHHLGTRNCRFIIFGKVIAPLRGLTLPEGFLEKAKSDTEIALNDLEKIWLKDSPFLAGDDPTVADLSAVCEISQLEMVQYDIFNGRPKLEAWMRKVKQIPHYKEVSAILEKFSGSGAKL